MENPPEWLMTKTILRKMIDEDRWDEIGRQFNFTPKFCLFQNKTYFDWSSAPGAMLDIVGWTGKPPTHYVRKFKYKRSPEPASKIKLPNRPGQTLIERLFNAQSGCCFYCGTKTEPKQRSKDHKLPRSRGGWGETNYVGSCKTCNHAKGNMTLEEFLSTDYLEEDRRALLGANYPPLKNHKKAQKEFAIRSQLASPAAQS